MFKKGKHSSTLAPLIKIANGCGFVGEAFFDKKINSRGENEMKKHNKVVLVKWDRLSEKESWRGEVVSGDVPRKIVHTRIINTQFMYPSYTVAQHEALSAKIFCCGVLVKVQHV